MVRRNWWLQHVRQVVPRDYIEALAGLPFLRDVPRADLRGRSPATWIKWTSKLDVGDRATGRRWRSVLRHRVTATFEVVRFTAEGRAETLATLGPGDYFWRGRTP